MDQLPPGTNPYAVARDAIGRRHNLFQWVTRNTEVINDSESSCPIGAAQLQRQADRSDGSTGSVRPLSGFHARNFG